MSARFLLDTNVVSELARPQPAHAVQRRFAAEHDACVLSSTVVHELEYGVRRLPPGRRRDALTELVGGLVDRLDVLAYDLRAAQWHAVERTRLEAAGRARPYADGQLAAVAAVNGLVLVTRNVRDVVGYDRLRVESWF